MCNRRDRHALLGSREGLQARANVRRGNNFRSSTGPRGADRALVITNGRSKQRALHAVSEPVREASSPLFLAVIEANEEAIYDSLFKAVAVGGSIDALPLEKVLEVIRGNR